MIRAIVVGSGIAGLAASLALRRVGISVTVYERASELNEVGAGISLWANALRALDHIGVGQVVRAESLPMLRSEFRVHDGRTVTASFHAGPFEQRFGVAPFVAMIHRAELVTALANCLPEGTIRYGYECASAESRGERAIVRFTNGHTDEADVVIGADGIHSAVRASVFGPSEPRYAGYTCWRGVCSRPSSLSPGYLAEWWGRGRRFGITTLSSDRVYWWATKNEPAGGNAADEQAYVAAAFRDWADPVPWLIAETPPAGVFRHDIFDRPPNRRWASGRVVLIGDAAHPTTPNFGQGGCMAIEDAVALARQLAERVDPEPGLMAFVRERYSRTTAITEDSRRFGRIGQWEGQMSCRLRDRAFGWLLPLIGSRSLPKYAAFDVGPLTTPAMDAKPTAAPPR